MSIYKILKMLDLRIRDNACGVFAPESMNTLRAYIRELEARAEAAEAKVARLRLREPDWWWRDLDPDDSGDTPHEALRNLPDFTVSHLRSSYLGTEMFAVRVPVLDANSDDDEVLLFDTEQEALDASKERHAALAAMENTDD